MLLSHSTFSKKLLIYPQELYTELAELRWQLGLRMISAGKLLVTDRLHATVLGALLGVPTFYYDALSVHGYAKIGGRCTLPGKAVRLAQRLLCVHGM